MYGPGWALPDSSVRASSGSGVGLPLASMPAITESAIAASVTLRAMGPVLSSSQSRGAIPAMLVSPRVGNTPITAEVADGMRIELPVSVPLPSTAMLLVTAVTVPPELPPGEKRTS